MMKKLLLTVVGITVFFISHTIGQDNKPAKGYYSITGKKEQLPAYTNPVVVNPGNENFPAVTKGYYSIKGHEKKLPRPLRIYLVPKARVAPKGYYSVPRSDN
jgi:hypothetical protein